MRILLVLAIGACSKAGGAPPDFVKGKYPGFTLDVPRQLGSPPPSADYNASVKQYRAGTEVFSIRWDAGALPLPQLEAGFVKSLMEKLGAIEIRRTMRVRAGASDALRIDLETSNESWSLVAIGCGERLIQVMVRARSNGEATLQRMLSTFACAPDPVKERAMADAVVVGLDDHQLLAGWHRAPAPGTFAITDGTHALSFTKATELADLELMRSMLEKDWRFGELRAEGSRHFVDFANDAGELGTLAFWTCGPERGVAAMAVGYPPADARALLGKFRCAKPGDKPLL